MCLDGGGVCLEVAGLAGSQDGRVGLGGVFHFLARRCGQLRGDALVDEPHGGHQLVHEFVLDVGEEAGVERDVLLQVGRTRVCVLGHRFDELPQVRVRRALHGPGERDRDPEVEGPARVDDRVQGLCAVDLVDIEGLEASESFSHG